MDLARQSLAITLVFALLGAALWLLKRKGILAARRNPLHRGSIEACGRLSLTAQHSIHLVRVGDRSLVVAVHPGGLTLLCDAGPELTRQSEGRPL